MQHTNPIQLQVLPPDQYSQNRFQVNDEWIIECVPTILGNTRVCLRQKDSVTLICNWCAGNRPKDIEYLFNVMLGYLEAGDVDLMPVCSRVKPYYQDIAFKATIKPYHRQYVSFTIQIGNGSNPGTTNTTTSDQSTSYFTLQS